MASLETYLTQRDLEARWKLSGRTLERWRESADVDWWSAACAIGTVPQFQSSTVSCPVPIHG